MQPSPSGRTCPRGRTDAVLTPEQLEVTAHSLTAVLGVWLGLTVLTRFRTQLARLFAFLSLTLVVWSGSIIVERLSTSASAIETAHAIEEITAALIVPAFAHLSLVIATEGHPSRRQLQVLALMYGLNALFVVPGTHRPGDPGRHRPSAPERRTCARARSWAGSALPHGSRRSSSGQAGSSPPTERHDRTIHAVGSSGSRSPPWRSVRSAGSSASSPRSPPPTHGSGCRW